MKKTLFIQVCAWCEKHLGRFYGLANDDDPEAILSHGICKECMERVFAQEVVKG